MIIILFLGPDDSPLLRWLKEEPGRVEHTSQKVDREAVEQFKPDIIISYNYRHILKQDVLDFVSGNAFNLHISYLPWNRGADPNLWSWIDDTPKGVTIHRMDAGIDTGPIYKQAEVTFSEDETLATSYAKLQTEIMQLFKDHWPLIQAGYRLDVPQPHGGSFHRSSDRHHIQLPSGWDTPVKWLIREARKHASVQLSRRTPPAHTF